MIGSKNILGVSYESWKRCSSICDFQVNVIIAIGFQWLPRESTVECLGFGGGHHLLNIAFIKN